MSKAREVGVDEESIHEAVSIGLKVRKGARGRFDKNSTPCYRRSGR